MRINNITNRYTKLNFGEKEYSFDNPEKPSNKKTALNKAKIKLIPAMLVCAGGICGIAQYDRQDRVNYYDMENFYKTYNTDIADPLESINEKTAVFKITNEKDSLTRETKNYLYKQTAIVSNNKIMIKGNIKRKTDGRELTFINIYKDKKLVERTIKDPNTGEKFYVDYENGSYSLKNKDGESVPDEQILLIMALSLAGGGVLYSMKNLHDAIKKDHLKAEESNIQKIVKK